MMKRVFWAVVNAELAKEIGRIAKTKSDGVEWDKVAKLSGIR